MTLYVCLVACRDLKNDDGSWAKVSMIRAESGEEEEVGRTAELMGDTPVFKKVFEFECDNTADDLLKVTILDENDQSRGIATFTLDTLFAHEKKLGYLEMSANRGAVVVHVEEKIETGCLKLKLRAKDLKNTEGFTRFRKPDPFWALSKLADNGGVEGQWKKVFASRAVKDELDPDWEESEIQLSALCGGDYDLPLKLEVFDQEVGDKHVIIGSRKTSVNNLLATNSDDDMPIAESSEITGSIFVEKAELDGVASSVADSKKVMKLVAVALENRSASNEKAESIEKLREDAAAAKAAAEAAQLEAEQTAQALEEAEGGLAEAVAAAEAAEAEIGGLA